MMLALDLIRDGIDVAPALADLEAHPELWDENTGRTESKTSPHWETSGIFLRFRARDQLLLPEHYDEPLFSVFWPAWLALPALHPIVYDIMARERCTCLGGMLLTRIPAGGTVYPHIDQGWHPTFFRTKAYVILRANDRCFNYCGAQSAVMQAGQAWRFDNSVRHNVENRGETERIALIITMRTEP